MEFEPGKVMLALAHLNHFTIIIDEAKNDSDSNAVVPETELQETFRQALLRLWEKNTSHRSIQNAIAKIALGAMKVNILSGASCSGKLHEPVLIKPDTGTSSYSGAPATPFTASGHAADSDWEAKQVTEAEVYNLDKELLEWEERGLACRLGLSHQQVTDIQYSNSYRPAIIRQKILINWRWMKGQGATWNALIDACNQCGMGNVAAKIATGDYRE